jgi:hypothetical protein
LALVECLRLMLNHSNQTVRLCAIGAGGMLLLAGMPQLWAYATQGWQQWQPLAPESTIEYQLAQWMALHPPVGRVFASGGLRFRLNSWYDLPQVGGGFETGLRNRVPVDLAWSVRAAGNLRSGLETEDTLLELKALGAQYVVVHGPKSQEYYRDFVRPERMAAVMQPVFHAADETIYALPPRPLAHLLRPEEIPHADVRDHHQELTRYVAVIDDPSRPGLLSRWTGTGTLSMTGATAPGDVVAVQVNADPGWRATQDGREIAVTQDALGFVVLHPQPAPATRIDLMFRGTLEQRMMAALSMLTWLTCLFTLFRARHA